MFISVIRGAITTWCQMQWLHRIRLLNITPIVYESGKNRAVNRCQFLLVVGGSSWEAPAPGELWIWTRPSHCGHTPEAADALDPGGSLMDPKLRPRNHPSHLDHWTFLDLFNPWWLGDPPILRKPYGFGNIHLPVSPPHPELLRRVSCCRRWSGCPGNNGFLI